MKKNAFIALFISAHVLFIFLQVHKHTQFIKCMYTSQEYEKKREVLKEKKVMLTQELHAQKNRDAIRKFARKKLVMRPIILSQVKRLQNDDT